MVDQRMSRAGRGRHDHRDHDREPGLQHRRRTALHLFTLVIAHLMPAAIQWSGNTDPELVFASCIWTPCKSGDGFRCLNPQSGGEFRHVAAPPAGRTATATVRALQPWFGPGPAPGAEA